MKLVLANRARVAADSAGAAATASVAGAAAVVLAAAVVAGAVGIAVANRAGRRDFKRDTQRQPRVPLFFDHSYGSLITLTAVP
jgi:hypothetical protein